MHTKYRYIIDVLDLTTGQEKWVFTSADLTEAKSALSKMIAVDNYLIIEMSELRSMGGDNLLDEVVIIEQIERKADGSAIYRTEAEGHIVRKTCGADAKLKLLEFGYASEQAPFR